MPTDRVRDRNDIPAANRVKLVELLNARLADTSDLYSQLKQAHWSVRGPDFFQLHELYDMIAERARVRRRDRGTHQPRSGLRPEPSDGSRRLLARRYPSGIVREDTVNVVADRLAAYGAAVREQSTPPTPSSVTWTRRTCSPPSHDRQAPLVRRAHQQADA
jgi:starvation-inducible DNA-binding protein